jgi:TatA/E family protein of Tat protein translocase
MHALLFVFEFLGTTELMVIALAALILFGPRKLPEIGRSVGKSIAEFKRASDDFKRTWEFEVELDQRKPETEVSAVAPPPPASPEELVEGSAHADAGGETVARTSAAWGQEGAAGVPAHDVAWDVATGHAQATDAPADGNKVSRADEEINAS